VPDRDGDEGSALLAHDGAIETLESVDDEQENMSLDHPRNRAIEDHREGAAEEAGELGGTVDEDVCKASAGLGLPL